jgi:hypothetical protein
LNVHKMHPVQYVYISDRLSNTWNGCMYIHIALEINMPRDG